MFPNPLYPDRNFISSCGRCRAEISEPALTRAVVDQRNLKELREGYAVIVRDTISALTSRGALNFFINPKLMLVIGNGKEENRGITGIWCEGEEAGTWYRLTEPVESWRMVYTALSVAANTLPDLKWYTDENVVRANTPCGCTINVMARYDSGSINYELGGQLANCRVYESGSEEGGFGSLPSRLLAHYNYLLSL